MEKDRQHVQTIVTKYYQVEIIKDPGYFKRQKKYKKQHNKNKQQEYQSKIGMKTIKML